MTRLSASDKDSARESVLVLALLAAAAWLCAGGPLIGRLGFYRDDWVLLQLVKSAGSWRELLQRVATQPQLTMRPLDVPELALAYRLFGDDPLRWQVNLAALSALTGFCVWRALRAFRAPRALAVLGALLFLAYPSKDTAIFWAGYINGPLALLAFLAGYLAHLKYVETGKKSALAAAVAAFALSLATYDSCLFLAPILLLTPRPVERPAKSRVGTSFTGLVLLILASAAWRMLAIRHLQAPAQLAVSPAHALMVYAASLNANLGPDLLWAALKSIARAFATAPIAASAALLLPLLALRFPEDEGRGTELAARKRLLLLGAAIYVLGNLPFAISTYLPAPMAEENRLNLVPVAGLVLALTGAASFLRARASRLILSLAAGLATAASVGSSASWGKAYDRALSVRGLIQRRLPDWPRQDALFLLQPELHVDGRAPVFDHEYVLDPAVRLWTGDSQRRSFVFRPGVETTAAGLRLDTGALFPYGTFDVLDSVTGEFLLHPGEARCRRLAVPENAHNPVASWLKRRLRR